MLAVVVAVLALSAGIAACGGDDDGDGGGQAADTGGETASESVDLPGADVSEEQLAETIRTAFFADVPVEEMDDLMVRTLRVASVDLSAEQQSKLQECISQNDCDTGTGGELVLGIADPFGGIPWRVQARVEATAQALAYPQVGRIIYNDGNADEQQSLANFRSLMSQGADVITGYYDFAASMPAMIKQAESQGIAVTSYISPVPEVEYGSDMTAAVISDLCDTGASMARQVIEAGGQNQAAALFTGVPGNASSAAWQDCATEEFEASGWEVPRSATTGWTPQGEIQAVSEMIASGAKVDALLYDNTGANLLVPYIREDATPPIVVSWANSLQYYNTFRKLPEGVRNFIIDGQTWTSRAGVTAGVETKLTDAEKPGVVDLPQPIVATSDALEVIEPWLDSGFPEGYAPPTFAPDEVVRGALE